MRGGRQSFPNLGTTDSKLVTGEIYRGQKLGEGMGSMMRRNPGSGDGRVVLERRDRIKSSMRWMRAFVEGGKEVCLEKVFIGRVQVEWTLIELSRLDLNISFWAISYSLFLLSNIQSVSNFSMKFPQTVHRGFPCRKVGNLY